MLKKICWSRALGYHANAFVGDCLTSRLFVAGRSLVPKAIPVRNKMNEYDVFLGEHLIIHYGNYKNIFSSVDDGRHVGVVRHFKGSSI